MNNTETQSRHSVQRLVRRPGDGWNRAISLKAGKAMTRDGRIVLHLREAIIDDGETILIGDVSTKRRQCYKPGDMILTEKHYWRGRGAWGSHGGDDLMTPNAPGERLPGQPKT
jgi:hypothetical protein